MKHLKNWLWIVRHFWGYSECLRDMAELHFLQIKQMQYRKKMSAAIDQSMENLSNELDQRIKSRSK